MTHAQTTPSAPKSVLSPATPPWPAALPFRVVQRARALLLAADGVPNVETAELVGVSRPTVLAWRADFAERGLVDFGEVREGRGRKPSIPAEKIAQVVDLTLHSKPAGHTHWSCRTMVERSPVISPLTKRLWRAGRHWPAKTQRDGRPDSGRPVDPNDGPAAVSP